MSSVSAPSTSSASSPAQATSGSSLSSHSFSASSPISSANNPSTHPPASSSPTASSTANAATSTSSTTSPTPTTTQQSSPAQTSSAAAQTTSPSSSTTTSSSSSSTTVPTTTSSFTSQVATTFSSTDPGGSVVYVTTTVPEVITTAVSSSTGGSSSNNTGVIVGAVVGGVAGIVILALLLFCIRRRVRKDEFDGNFDPDRVVGHTEGSGGTLPHVDLADEVTPFPQPQSYTDQGSSSMRQYGKSPYFPVPSSLGGSGHASTEFYPPGAMGMGASTIDAQPRSFMQPGAGAPPPGAYIPPINMHGTGPLDWHSPRPGVSPPPSTVSNNTASTRATKEREAMGRGGQGTGLGLTTQQEAPEGSGDVVVHRDAGRAPIEEHAPPREIPPAYESIRD